MKLIAVGCLAPVEAFAFARFCLCQARRREAVAILNAEGATVDGKASPCGRIARDLETALATTDSLRLHVSETVAKAVA